MRAVRTTVLMLVLLVIAMSAPAAQPLAPLIAEWDQYFSVHSRPVAVGERAVGSGTIWNVSGWGARRIQLLVEGLDDGGRPIDQRVMWLGADLPAGAHAHFQTPLPASPAYRVRVFAFHLENTGGPR
jgi:predicted metal-binding membrane protein